MLTRAVFLALLSAALLACPCALAQQGGDPFGEGPSPFGGSTVAYPAKVPVSPAMRVGWHATQRTTLANGSTDCYYAVVGEEGDSWKIEHYRDSPDAPRELLGLTVNKSDGAVTAVMVGKPGGPLRELPPHGSDPFSSSAPKPEGRPVSLALPFGEVPATRVAHGDGSGPADFVRWVGREAPLQGVVLKITGLVPYELLAPPEREAVEVGASELPCWKLSYSNGTQQWLSDDPIVRAFFPSETGAHGVVRTVTRMSELRIVSRGEDATPQLDW